MGLFAVLIDAAFYPYGQPLPIVAHDRGTDGLWLHHDWYLGHPTDTKIQSLAQRLKSHGIRYAYFHLRSVDHEGKLRYPLGDSALRLTETLHRAVPGIQVIAWVYAGNARAGGAVDLSSGEVRKRMAAEAGRLVRTYGFDAIQWDYEICPNDDGNFLKLLEETRKAVGAGKRISVATAIWLPSPLRRWGWSDAYFREVAARCDQIAVMAYDSGIYLPRLYVSLVKQQVVHVTRAASEGNPRCQVLIGLPTYEEGGLSHTPRVENLRLSLRGVREGLADPRTAHSAFAGVALFADYTTDDAEWRTYDQLWKSFNLSKQD